MNSRYLFGICIVGVNIFIPVNCKHFHVHVKQVCIVYYNYILGVFTVGILQKSHF